MPQHKMRIVYDIVSKKIKQVSISDKCEPTCKQICSYHDESHIIDEETGHCTNCENCFAVERDESILDERFIYEIDDSDPVNKVTKKRKYYKIEWESDATLIDIGPPKRYSIAENTTANMTIKFVDEDDEPIMPVGRLKLRIKKGKTSLKQIDLDGTQSEISFTWKSPKDDNSDVWFRARISNWHPKVYNSSTSQQMIMEIE